MALAPGTRLGPYEIVGPLGAGGMGEVYKAIDARLDRAVAVKVLPEHVASDPELRQRFEREAKAISSLNHPHICTLHDVGSQGGIDFLVMELLEGETLAQRLTKGALPLDLALRYAMEIADALDKAHRQGIVHRDLKPGNVMLVTSGTKLLDFGLAKTRPVATTDPAALSGAPTATSPLTGAGSLIGTLHYMAPEQLEGKTHDARVDVFAFGVILFEMITGRRAFDGASAASIAGAVLHKTPPPITAEVPSAPAALSRLVATCLDKDPEDRWSSMHDVLLHLRAIAPDEHAQVGASPRRSRREHVAWATAVVLGLAAAAAWFVPRPAPVTQPATRPDLLSILPPPGATPSYGWEAPQVSPDGRHVAFAASDASGTVRLYIRSRDVLEPRQLPGTEDATLPFWSPDSTRLGFFAASQLKTISLDGGVARTIAAAPVPRGGDWGRDDVILFSALPNNPPFLVPAAGGEPRPAPVAGQERGFRSFPRLLPDGRHYLYQSLDPVMGGPLGVRVASLDSTDVRDVVKTRSNGIYVNGRLFFVREAALMAQPFDLASLQVQDTPTVIAEGVGFNAITHQALFSTSENVLAYLGAARGARLAWFDREGRSLGAATQPGDFSTLCLTADDRGVVFEQANAATGTVDLWHLDLNAGQPTRLTFDPAVDFYPVCGPPGPTAESVIFASLRAGPPSLFRLPIGAPGSEKPALVSFFPKLPSDWTDRGQSVVFSILNPKTGWDIAVWSTAGGEPRPLVTTLADERSGRVSPDGRFLAYTAREEGGRFEIYVQPYPSGGAKWQVSSGGGMQPLWRSDGTELYYVSADRNLMAVPIKANPSDFAFGEGRALMVARTAGWEAGIAINAQYAVTRDGQRFLISTAAEAPPIVVMLNWTAIGQAQR